MCPEIIYIIYKSSHLLNSQFWTLEIFLRLMAHQLPENQSLVIR